MDDGPPLSADQAARVRRLVRSKVYKFLGGRGGYHPGRNDLEQDVWISVLRRLPAYDPARASLITYLHCVIDSALIDLKRKYLAGRRNPVRNARSLQSHFETAADDGEGDCEQSECLDAERQQFAFGRRRHSEAELTDLTVDVRDALAALPPEDREFCLRVMQESMSDVADESGINRGTAYRRLEALRGHFEDCSLRDYMQ